MTVGRRTLAAGELEVQIRRGRWSSAASRSRAPRRRSPSSGESFPDDAGRSPDRPDQAPAVRDRPLGAAAARRPRLGQPLNPWTIPNAIGYLRLAGIPVFLIVALSSGDGQRRAAAMMFAVIGWADYLDGFAARLTGQYSRLGALLDPIVDRLLVVSGMVVCWHFELLPRWAIAIVIARELLMLALSRYGAAPRGRAEDQLAGAARGRADHGRAVLRDARACHWLALVLLYVGMALALTATALYVAADRRGTCRRSALAERTIHKSATSGQTLKLSLTL